jgi:hypothetical protein
MPPFQVFIEKSGLNLTWATLHFVGWDEHTLSFVGFRFTQPNLHFTSSIAQCETQQRPILESSPKNQTDNDLNRLKFHASNIRTAAKARLHSRLRTRTLC